MGNKIKTNYMQNFINSFLYILATLFLIFVAVPAYVFWLNSNDISWQGTLWLTQFAVSMSFALLAAAIIAPASEKIRRVFNGIIATVFIFVFIRIFFTPVSFGVLEGVEINDVQIFSDASLWVSIALLAVIVFCTLKYVKPVGNLIQITALILFLLVGYIYFGSISGVSGAVENTLSERSHLSRFSKKSNIIVVSFDSIQNDILVELLTENSRLENTFDDFTLYADVTSYAPNTNFSLLSTSIGRHIQSGEDGDSLNILREAYQQISLPSIMAKQGYDADTFNLPCDLVKNTTCLSAAGVLPKNISVDYRLTAYDVSILKVVPKSISWHIIRSLSESNVGAIKNEMTLIAEDKAAHGFGMGKHVFKKMYEEIYLVDQPVFKFHHYLHSHQPVRFDENCRYDVTTPQNIESAKSEISCVLNEFGVFLTKLKDAGIYNEALIVLTSDHGYESNMQPSMKKGEEYNGGYINNSGVWSASRYWPILLIKKPGAKGTLKFNHAPVSLVDIAPTLFDVANIDICKSARCDGTRLPDSNKPREKERKVMIYDGGAQNLEGKHTDTQLFVSENIVGNAYDGVKKAMVSVSLGNQMLNCNQVLSFNKKIGGYDVKGMSGVEVWGRWSNGKEASILFNLNATQCTKNQLKLKLKGFVTNKNKAQHADVLLNGTHIGEALVKFGEQNPRDFVFSVSPELIKQGEVNKLEFRIENPTSPKSLGVSTDPRLLGFGFESMVFQ